MYQHASYIHAYFRIQDDMLEMFLAEPTFVFTISCCVCVRACMRVFVCVCVELLASAIFKNMGEPPDRDLGHSLSDTLPDTCTIK